MANVKISDATDIVSLNFNDKFAVARVSDSTPYYATMAEVQTAMWTDPNFIGIPTTPTATLGDNSSQVASTAFVTNSIALVTGVTWHDVTSSRALATTYTNSLSYPISVIAVIGATGPTSLPGATVDGTVINGPVTIVTGLQNVSFPFQVPSGKTYSIAAGGSLASWFEMS